MGTDVRAADIRTGVDQPLYVRSICTAQIDPEGLGEGKICAIAALLIPALDTSSD